MAIVKWEERLGGVNMKNPIKSVPKNVWIIGIAIVGGYLLYRNIHRN